MKNFIKQIINLSIILSILFLPSITNAITAEEQKILDGLTPTNQVREHQQLIHQQMGHMIQITLGVPIIHKTPII